MSRDPAVLSAPEVLELLKQRQHPAVRMIAREVWPSFSGVDEIVSLALRPDGAGWTVDGEVLPDQFDVRPESFREHLDDDRVLRVFQASWWGDWAHTAVAEMRCSKRRVNALDSWLVVDLV